MKREERKICCRRSLVNSSSSPRAPQGIKIEQHITEQFAKSNGLWLPLDAIFELGVLGPSGNENDTYVADDAVFKVNNLFNCGCITGLLEKVLLHNTLFPNTAYNLFGFTGCDGRSVLPILQQNRVSNARPATQVMIGTYMAALGFTKTDHEGRFQKQKKHKYRCGRRYRRNFFNFHLSTFNFSSYLCNLELLYSV